MPHTPETRPGAPELAGVRLAQARGRAAQTGLLTGARLQREFGQEREAAIKRQEEEAKKRRRRAELFTIAGTIAGFLIPGGLVAGGLTKGLIGAALGGRLGAAAGTAAAGAPPGALAFELPGTFGALGESRRLGEMERALQFRPELTFQPGPFAPGPGQRPGL